MPIGPMPMQHDARRFANPGFPPTKWPPDTALGIEYAGGHIPPRTYRADQLRWTLTGHAFDIARFWRA